MDTETQQIRFLCLVGENGTKNGRTPVIVNKDSILDEPDKNIEERLVESDRALPSGRMIYVTKAFLDLKTRIVRIKDYKLIQKDEELTVELSNEELARVNSLDETPMSFMEFIYSNDDGDTEDDSEEDQELSDSEEEV